MPPAGLFRVHLEAQIATAQNFEYTDLRINYLLKLPTGLVIVIDYRIIRINKSF